MKRILFILLALNISINAYAQISKIEKKINSNVDANNHNAIKLLFLNHFEFNQ